MLTQTAIRTGSFKQPIAAVRPPSAAPTARAGTIEMIGALMPFAAASEIYGENEPADYLYKVVSGTVRTYKVLVDGRRQIGAFYLPGDIFGFETEDEHTFSAEAVTDCKIIVIKRSAVTALAAEDNDVARQMWALTARELHRVQDHIMVLIKSAQERVAGFLLEMAERTAGRRHDRAADVTPGHRRLSRPHHRDRLAHAHAAGEIRRDRGADLAPDRAAQPLRAQSPERVVRSRQNSNEGECDI